MSFRHRSMTGLNLGFLLETHKLVSDISPQSATRSSPSFFGDPLVNVNPDVSCNALNVVSTFPGAAQQTSPPFTGPPPLRVRTTNVRSLPGWLTLLRVKL